MTLTNIEQILALAISNGSNVVVLSTEVVQQLVAIVKLIEADIKTDAPAMQKLLPALQALRKLF